MSHFNISVNIPPRAAQRLGRGEPTVVVCEDGQGVTVQVRWSWDASRCAAPDAPASALPRSTDADQVDLEPTPQVAVDANRWLEERLRAWDPTRGKH